ncbi:MAG: hypothetical protein GVY07_08400 [Bacteroidetes bacterium]|jgi:hypothetical protein|nr:hypothetical protein [Bacteroidota bacterium]
MDTTINQYQILSALKGIDATESRKTVLDYDNFLKRVQRKIFTQSFIVHYENAEKCHWTGDNFGEMKSLIYALNILESDKITDEDLKDASLLDYKTKTGLTSEKIAHRLQTLR